jgi:hypothetical protein
VCYHRFNHRVMPPHGHHPVAAHGISEKSLHAAHKAEGGTVHKKHVARRRWLWTLTPLAGATGEDGTLPVPEMFAKFAKFAFFNRAAGEGQELLLTSRWQISDNLEAAGCDSHPAARRIYRFPVSLSTAVSRIDCPSWPLPRGFGPTDTGGVGCLSVPCSKGFG